jgi:hypothetical protein
VQAIELRGLVLRVDDDDDDDEKEDEEDGDDDDADDDEDSPVDGVLGVVHVPLDELPALAQHVHVQRAVLVERHLPRVRQQLDLARAATTNTNSTAPQLSMTFVTFVSSHHTIPPPHHHHHHHHHPHHHNTHRARSAPQ